MRPIFFIILVYCVVSGNNICIDETSNLHVRGKMENVGHLKLLLWLE